MKIVRSEMIFLILSLSYFVQAQSLWYDQPAELWTEAVPVGNGHLGAMVFSKPFEERIQLNEDSLWPGGPDWADQNKGNPEDLEEIRKMLRAGEPHNADSLMVEKFSRKQVKFSHQTLGDIHILFDREEDKYSNYTRWLSLDSAIIHSQFTIKGDQVSQQVFCSYPDDVLVVRLETSAPGGQDFDVVLSRPEDKGHPTVNVLPTKNGLVMDGMVTQYGGIINSEPHPIKEGVRFQGLLKASTNSGSIRTSSDTLHIENAQTATLYFFCNTSFYEDDFERANELLWQKIRTKTYEDLVRDHVQDYQRLYSRVTLELGETDNSEQSLDKRLEMVKAGSPDPALEALLFQYGRYLLITSSRPGSNPANLQGLWNEAIEAPWNADYHLNINLQMNYWPAEITNLSECEYPLFDFIDRLIENGKKTARLQYGCRGAVVHHTTDLWAPTWMRAARAYWGSWIHGGGWIARQLWDHFEFTQDSEFLEKRAIQVFKKLSLFYCDWLQPDPEDPNRLISYPATSPENSYLTRDDQRAASSMGTAMDHQIIADVFDYYLLSAEILDIQNEFVEEVQVKRKKLADGNKIGPDGRLLEWDRAYEEVEKGHRHMSHLYSFYPSDQITIQQDPILTEAVRKSINYRLQHGGAGPGWSRTWLINFSARLQDPEMAREHINKFLKRSVTTNLFCLHPPFQIDGNFGFTAGVAELLLQSHQGFVELLPAIPREWNRGMVKGLKARGGFEVEMDWDHHKLNQAMVTSNQGKSLPIVSTIPLSFSGGELKKMKITADYFEKIIPHLAVAFDQDNYHTESKKYYYLIDTEVGERIQINTK